MRETDYIDGPEYCQRCDRTVGDQELYHVHAGLGDREDVEEARVVAGLRRRESGRAADRKHCKQR